MKEKLFHLSSLRCTVFIATMFGIFVNAYAQPDVELATRGVLACQRKIYDSAIVLLDSAIKINPKLPSTIYLRLGLSYEALHLYDSAITTYASFRKMPILQLYVRQITIFTEIKKDAKKARNVWNLMSKFYPKTPELYMELYKILELEGQKQSAVDTLLYALKAFQMDIHILKNYLAIGLKEKRYNDIIEICDKVLLTRKDSEDILPILVEMIDSLLAHGENDRSKILMRKIDSLQINDANKNSLEFKYYLKTTKDSMNALETGRKLLLRQPKNTILLYEMANLEQLKGEKRKALEINEYLFNNGFTVNAANLYKLYFDIAKEYQQMGAFRNGIEIFKSIPPSIKLLEEDKLSGARVDYAISKLYYMLNDFISAKKYSESAIKVFMQQQQLEPNNAELFLRTALCYLVMNDLTNAEGNFQKYFNRTVAKGKEEAISQLEELVRENINKPDAEYLLNKYKSTTEVSGTNGDITRKEKVTLIQQMVIESFGESAKVNPEADKSYIIVHSQIPWLRFDSNRRIIKVDQISDGEWGLWLSAGTHILKIDSKGFQRLELPPINFAKSRSFDLRIKAAPAD